MFQAQKKSFEHKKKLLAVVFQTKKNSSCLTNSKQICFLMVVGFGLHIIHHHAMSLLVIECCMDVIFEFEKTTARVFFFSLERLFL